LDLCEDPRPVLVAGGQRNHFRCDGGAAVIIGDVLKPMSNAASAVAKTSRPGMQSSRGGRIGPAASAQAGRFQALRIGAALGCGANP
jgi:hypothetical protein